MKKSGDSKSKLMRVPRGHRRGQGPLANHKSQGPVAVAAAEATGQACAEESAVGVPRGGVEAQPLQDLAAGDRCHGHQVFQRGTLWDTEPQVWLDSGLEEKGLEPRGGWRRAGSGMGDWTFSPLWTCCTPMPGVYLPLLLSYLKPFQQNLQGTRLRDAKWLGP